MKLVLARIDNRLIHGQVLEAWVPNIHANCIIVANDEVAQTTMRRLLMEAAVPKSIQVIVNTVEAVAHLLNSAELGDARVLLLFATARDALLAFRAGAPITTLNLGNMHAGAGKLKCSCTIALAPEDIEDLQALEAAGVEIVSQCVPTEREVAWSRMLPKVKGEG
jgi:PTS system mannose-specific IIB component